MQVQDEFQKGAAVEADRTRLLIVKLLEARRQGDLKTFASFFAPWVIYEIIAPYGLVPYQGRRHGIDGLVKFIQFNHTNYAWREHEITDLWTDDDGAIVRWRALFRNRGMSLVQKLDCCSLLRFHKGLVDEFIEYADTAALKRLLYGDE